MCNLPEFCNTYNVKKAQKEHTCCECRKTIKIGESYRRTEGKWDKFRTFKTCTNCWELRLHLIFADEEYCESEGIPFGEVLDYIQEEYGKGIKTISDLKRRLKL